MNKEAKTNIFMYNLARVMSLVVCLLTLSHCCQLKQIGIICKSFNEQNVRLILPKFYIMDHSWNL